MLITSILSILLSSYSKVKKLIEIILLPIISQTHIRLKISILTLCHWQNIALKPYMMGTCIIDYFVKSQCSRHYGRYDIIAGDHCRRSNFRSRKKYYITGPDTYFREPNTLADDLHSDAKFTAENKLEKEPSRQRTLYQTYELDFSTSVVDSLYL